MPRSSQKAALLFLFIFINALPRPTFANDQGTTIAMRFFSDTCLPRIGKPDEIRTWAAAHKFPEITKQELLDVFVGAGSKGTAWMVPSPEGKPHLALSVRGTSEACAIWIERADSEEITQAFSNMVEGIARPGINVTREPDKTSTSQFGIGRAIMYEVSGPDQPIGFEFTLLTSEKPGGLFQASLQVSLVQPH